MKTLIWKRKFNTNGRKRELQYHYARHEPKYNLWYEFHIKPIGGHITVKRYWLHITRGTGRGINQSFSLRFYKCRDAKTWAENFLNGGAKITANMMNSIYN